MTCTNGALSKLLYLYEVFTIFMPRPDGEQSVDYQQRYDRTENSTVVHQVDFCEYGREIDFVHGNDEGRRQGEALG